MFDEDAVKKNVKKDKHKTFWNNNFENIKSQINWYLAFVFNVKIIVNKKEHCCLGT